MALTLEAEQKMMAVSLIELFDEYEAEWKEIAKQTYVFVRARFPADDKVRPDDVAKALEPMLEVNKKLANKLAQKKLTQRYWKRHFTDLIIDRVWTEIT